jgi:hypothetical protein
MRQPPLLGLGLLPERALHLRLSPVEARQGGDDMSDDQWEGHTRPDLHRCCGRRAWSESNEWCYEDAPCDICWEHLYGDKDDVRAERDRLAAENERLRAQLEAAREGEWEATMGEDL